MARVFLSYSHKDKEYADRIASDLDAAGIGVWIDALQVDVGDSVPDRIADALSSHDYFAIIMTQNSVKSLWVRKELNIALMRSLDSKAVTILPIRVDDCDIPALLTDIQYADFRRSYADGINFLLRKLRKTQGACQSGFTDGGTTQPQPGLCLHLLDVREIQDTNSECAFPIFDFKLANYGAHTSFITRIDVHVLEAIPEFIPIPCCQFVFVSEQYNLMLDPLERPGIRCVMASHALTPNEVDRFQLRIGANPGRGRYRDRVRGPEMMESALFRVKFDIRYDGERSIETRPFTFRIAFPGDWHHVPPPVLLGPGLSDKVNALGHESARVRVDAVRNLALINDPSTLPKLLECLSDPEPRVAREAALAAASLGASEVLDALAEDLNTAIAAERGHDISEIAAALAHIDDAAVDRVLSVALQRMLSLRSDQEFGAYWWPMDALIEGLAYRKRVDVLELLLFSDESAIRSRSADQLGRLGGPDSVKALLTRLSVEKDGYVVNSIVRGLRISADRTVIPLLEDTLARIQSRSVEKLDWLTVPLNEYILETIESLRWRSPQPGCGLPN